MKRTMTAWTLVALCAGCGGSSSSPLGAGGAGGAAGSGTGGAGGAAGSGSGGSSGSTGGAAGTGAAGSGSGQGSYASGVAPSATLATLSDGDLNKMCTSLDAYFDSGDRKAASCKFAGYTSALFTAALGSPTDADVQKACTDAITSCLAGDVDAGATTQSTCARPAGMCTATVGEFETCENDALALQQTISAALPACNTLTVASLKTGAGPTGGDELPASCKTFQMKCPGGAMGM